MSCDKPWQKIPGLDVNHQLQKLCQRHGAAEVLGRVKDWVAYMERQIAISRAFRAEEHTDAEA